MPSVAKRHTAPGWKTSEHWALWGLFLLGALFAFRGASPSHGWAPALAFIGYAIARAIVKSISVAALPQGVPMDIDATIDAFITKFVASKIPATSALQPECDAAITAAEALAHKALEVYAVKLIAKNAPQLITALRQAFPNAGL